MSEHKPITGELRKYVGIDRGVCYMSEERFDARCDEIDSVHAQLERENAALKAELDRVLGEQEEHMHMRGGSITDELRSWAEGDALCAGMSLRTARDQALAIADRIDAEYQKAIRELNNLADASVLLPVDADGEIIHVGDMMERGKARGHVIALMLSEYPKKWGGALHWGVQLKGEQAPTALDLTFHHHHAPTVEDVLREFANEVYADADNEIRDRDFLCAKYAKRLKLAEGENA